MKILFTLALISILAVPVLATVDEGPLDPDPDMMGLYFDQGGTVYCTQAGTFAHVPLYVLYTRPTLELVSGFECGITVTGVANSQISISGMPTGYTNSGTATNLIVNYASPIPANVVTELAQLDVYYLEWGTPLFFYIGPSSPSLGNGLPAVYFPDEDAKGVLATGTSVAPGDLMAVINGECDIVANEDVSFGAVKALFR